AAWLSMCTRCVPSPTIRNSHPGIWECACCQATSKLSIPFSGLSRPTLSTMWGESPGGESLLMESSAELCGGLGGAGDEDAVWVTGSIALGITSIRLAGIHWL